jgi:hypothetical protein
MREKIQQLDRNSLQEIQESTKKSVGRLRGLGPLGPGDETTDSENSLSEEYESMLDSDVIDKYDVSEPTAREIAAILIENKEKAVSVSELALNCSCKRKQIRREGLPAIQECGIAKRVDKNGKTDDAVVYSNSNEKFWAVCDSSLVKSDEPEPDHSLYNSVLFGGPFIVLFALALHSPTYVDLTIEQLRPFLYLMVGVMLLTVVLKDRKQSGD